MNAKILSYFLDAAVEVITAELGGPVERGAVSLQEASYATNDVSVLLNIVGRLQGAIVYGMSEESALNVVSQMMGQPMHELDDLAQSGVAELGNVITGRAGTLLAANGYPITISVPSLIIGRATLSILDFRRLVIPLTFKKGVIDVHLAVREVPGA